MKCFLTGTSGFLGGAVAQAARQAGNPVATATRGDFASAEALGAKIRSAEPDCVFHFAGSASVADSFADPLRDFEASVGLTSRLLEGVRLSGIAPRVILASSAAVYGSPVELPIPETAPLRPESPYGFHKLLAEKVGEEYARCFGLDVTALRFFSIFGPRQKRLLVWELFDQLRRGESALKLKGTGDEERDFLAEDEAATATLAVAASCLADVPVPGFSPVNIASGRSVTVRTVAEHVRRSTGSSASIQFGHEALRGNPARWAADVSRLSHRLPVWKARPFEESLQHCVAKWKL